MSRSDACCLVVKVVTLNAQCLMPTLHKHAGRLMCVCVCVCVFFLGGGSNFCHKKLPEAEVGELIGTNL